MINRLTIFSALVVALASGPMGFAAGSRSRVEADNAEPVKMSPFEVYANSVEFQKWIKLSSPHYILYTDADLKEGTKVIRECEMLRIAAQVYFRRKELDLKPVVLVLPTSHSDWAKIAAKGAIEWRAAVTAMPRPIQNLIISNSDWDIDGLSMVHGVQGWVETRRMNLEGPFWFSHGIMTFFETAEFDDDKITLGRDSVRSTNVSYGGWFEWPRFFKVTQSSPEFRQENLVSQFSGQCAVFTQYLLTNPDLSYTVRLITWASLMAADREPTETDFKAVFGQDWKGWQNTMRTYTDHGRYQLAAVKIKPEDRNPPVTKLELPVREMRELFILSRILNQQVPESQASLDALLAKGLKTDSLRELLIVACMNWERQDAALEQARQLIAQGTTNPEVYSVAATLLFFRRVRHRSIDSRIDAADARQIEEWCRQALKLEPLDSDANDLLAMTIALGPEVTPEDAETIKRIYQVQKDNVSTGWTVSALAIARWRSGDPVRAREIVQVLKSSPFADKDSRDMAAELDKKLASMP